MAKRNEYVDYLLELMAPAGGISARAMFGGHGIYKDGRMFGLVADDVMYLKADSQNLDAFTTRGLGPFLYVGKNTGKPVAMRYHRCPDDALESPALMADWVRIAFAAALRANNPGSKKAR